MHPALTPAGGTMVVLVDGRGSEVGGAVEDLDELHAATMNMTDTTTSPRNSRVAMTHA
jgi:hypothetical protein